MPFPAIKQFAFTTFRKHSTFLTGIFVSAFLFEMVFDTATDKLWDYLNKGRQWKDIEHKYTTES